VESTGAPELISMQLQGRKVRYASDSRRMVAAQRNDAICQYRTSRPIRSS
jgi:hypothetical protein